jgi:hypothetical protein
VSSTCSRLSLVHHSRDQKQAYFTGMRPIVALVICVVLFALRLDTVRAACQIEPDENGHVDIPSTWTTINASAFSSCTTLVTLLIPNTITEIGYQAFYQCSNLASLAIPASVINIRTRAFAGVPLGSITLAAGSQLEIIEHDAFSGCTSMSGTLVLPPTIKNVGVGAFYVCWQLTISFSCGTVASFSSDNPFYGTNGCTSCQPTIAIPSTVSYSGPRTTLDCSSCAVGEYAASAGGASCSSCSLGYTTASSGTIGASQSVCTVCAAGYFSSTGHASGTAAGCTACAAGFYSTAAGSTECTACDAGYSTASSGSTSAAACDLCDVGYEGVVPIIPTAPSYRFQGWNFDATAQTWADSSGNARDIASSALVGAIATVTQPAGTNGVTKSFAAVSGDPSTKLYVGNSQ